MRLEIPHELETWGRLTPLNRLSMERRTEMTQHTVRSKRDCHRDGSRYRCGKRADARHSVTTGGG